MKEHKAGKRFGQSLLQGTRIIADIVNVVRPQANDVMIEIDPGLAAITEPLTRRLNHLHVVEIDRDIVGRLRALPFADKLAIHEGDVLQFDFNDIASKKRIVGDLPYNVPTLLLLKLAKVTDDVVEVHFMLRKEVVGHVVAAPKSSDYSHLGVMLQYFFDMELLIDVPPESFDPAPKVDSTVIRMIPMKHRIGKADDFEHLARPVKLALHQCRKTIRSNLRKFAGDEDLQTIGISPQDRAEHIAPEKYMELSNYLVRKAT